MSPSKHARDAARARAERQAAKREAARRRKRRTIAAVSGTVVGILLLTLVIVLVSSGDKKSTLSTSSQQTQPAATPSGSSNAGASTCSYPAGRKASKNVGIPPATPAGKKVTASLKTTVGQISFEMDGTKAPCTTNAFTYLASKGYFDSTPCHRLTTQGIFVLQCGSPDGSGSGGPGFSFADENLTGLGTTAGASAIYPAGTIAMANSGANTNGSQFFIVYKDSPLAANYTPFGHVIIGLDVVAKVGADGVAGGGADGAPKDKVTISSFRVA